MSAHTPGPWAVDGDEQGEHALLGVYIAAGAADGGRVARTFANCLVTTDEECRANARLIAAAPELLEALVEMLAMCANFDLDGDRQTAAIEAAERAIAKATEAT